MGPPTSIFPQVLFVEDHVDTVDVMTRHLLMQGFLVTPAATAAAAIELVQKQAFSALICDLGLPDMDGLELMLKLRAYTQAPAIALSGRCFAEDQERSRRAGFAVHLCKPVQIADLTSVLRRLIWKNDRSEQN